MAQQADVEEVIVTGTRVSGLRAVDSPAPIQVLGADLLTKTGQPDLIQSLAQNVPSFTAQAFGGDAAAMTLSAKLRGVSPNHALVLVNGKRRHGTSNLAVLGGPYQGGATTDLNFIPVASIDHVEVLLDGAAAQYGSDAIAGVINIIQKKRSSGGQITATGGEYIDGGGRTGALAFNGGFEPFENAYVNVTAETKYHGFSFRGVADPRTYNGPHNAGAVNSPARSYPQIVNAPGYPNLNLIAGDPQYRISTISYNAGYELPNGVEIYSFGSYGDKFAQAHENYRLPNVVTGKSPTDIPFQYGFDPRLRSDEQDYSFTLGAMGEVGDWTWDLASTYGRDDVKLTVMQTANADLYKDTSTLTTPGYTPRNIVAGSFMADQWTTTFDVTKTIDVGFTEPMTFAAGLEYREDGYGIAAGDPASYYKGGSQSYYGFAPINAGNYKRDSKAAYVDLAASPVDGLKLDAALRYGKFSDFGETTVAKLTGRYDFTELFALRGTVSSGFRAPTLAEGYYAGINVSPSSISGQLPPNSPGAALLGINGLKPEKSTNYSFGFVAHPISRLSITFDAYQIEIKDRIVGSGTLYGDASNKALLRSPAVLAALAANGVQIDPSIYTNANWSIGVSLFTNGLDTRTKGADFVMSYASDFDAYGTVDWVLTANYTDTKVTRIAAPPSQLAAGVSLFDRASIANLESAAPRYRVVAGGTWNLDKWSVSLKESVFGPASGMSLDGFDATWRETKIDAAVVTDLEVSYEVLEGLKLTAGANNLFNKYPNRINGLLRQHQLQQNSNAYVTQYPTFSPFGINGGYYYGKLTWTF
ncbi:MAG: TonB-dependent receptor [Caulobacterales bacterium]|nr:TonB-dependent receptor [Caulobacterales bacterium]